MYCVPSDEIDPSIVAALAVRRQISFARSWLNRASFGCAISFTVSAIFSSLSKFKNGDCSSCDDNPWRNAPSNTLSPVLLAKSASTTVSLSVNFAAPRLVNRNPASAATTTSTTAIPTQRIVDDCCGCEVTAALFAAVCEPVSRFNRCKSARISAAFW
jgi:hypothetical protein